MGGTKKIQEAGGAWIEKDTAKRADTQVRPYGIGEGVSRYAPTDRTACRKEGEATLHPYEGAAGTATDRATVLPRVLCSLSRV